MTKSGAVVIGGGPAGLMAAEQILAAGYTVALYDAMPSLGRKFLLAGRGGLNLTHAEGRNRFRSRYYQRHQDVGAWLEVFDNQSLRAWADELGAETFVGSSGRIFPREMKAAPLLRSWLRRLREQGLQTYVRHRWLGWTDDGHLRFAGPVGIVDVPAAITVLALGGASWPNLGSDGSWVDILAPYGILIAPLLASNCGFEVEWSNILQERFAGAPLKNVVLTVFARDETVFSRRGELVVSTYGVEGNLVYAASAWIRDLLSDGDVIRVELDLMPDRNDKWLRRGLRRPAGKRSLSNHLRRTIGLEGVRLGLLREYLSNDDLRSADTVIQHLKNFPLKVTGSRPIAEAISSAGGVSFAALDDQLMVKALPGLFCAGEMIDWEAPTGGYLLTACFASGYIAGKGAARWLAGKPIS